MHKAGVGKAPLEDVVPVNENPAYQMVTTYTLQRSDKSQLKSILTAPSYENIPGMDVEHKENEKNICDEGDYENVE